MHLHIFERLPFTRLLWYNKKNVPILEEPMKKVLFVATLVKNHVMEFHLPYLKLFCDHGWQT